MTAGAVENHARSGQAEAGGEQPTSAPVLHILGDPSVGTCTDGFCEVPDLAPDDPAERDEASRRNP